MKNINVYHYLKRHQFVGDFIEEDIKKFLESEYKIMYIFAAPGSGKTEAVINSKYNEIHLVEPFRKIISEKFRDRGFYQDVAETRPTFNYFQHDKVVSTPDQFMKYCHVTKEYVFVDEIHELYDAYYREKCLDFMKWLLLTEKKVIVMTGTPAGELELFKDYEIPIYKVNYIKEPLYETKFYHITTEKKLDACALDLVKRELEKGKFVGVYTNRYWRKLAQYTAPLNFLLIHSQEGDHQTPLSDVGKYKGIMYTKVLSCGCDINDALDVTLIFPSEPLLSTFEITQAIGRFRHAERMSVYFIHHESEARESTENFTQEWFDMYSLNLDTELKSMFKHILKSKAGVSLDEKENLVLDNEKLRILKHIIENKRKRSSLKYILKAFKWEEIDDNFDNAVDLEKEIIDEKEFIDAFADYSDIYKDYHEKRGYKVFSEVFIKDDKNYVDGDKIHTTSPSFTYSLLKNIYLAKHDYHTENWKEILDYSFDELKKYNNAMYLLYNTDFDNIDLENISIEDFMSSEVKEILLLRAQDRYKIKNNTDEEFEEFRVKLNGYVERFIKKTNKALNDLLKQIKDMRDWSRNETNEFDFDWLVNNFSHFYEDTCYYRAHRISQTRRESGSKGGRKGDKIVIKNIETNEIKEFESKAECLKFLGLSKPSGKDFFNGKIVKKVQNWRLNATLPNQN